MGVGRNSRPLRGVEVLAMCGMGLDTMRCVECVGKVPQSVGVLRLLVPSVVVAVLIDHHCGADGVEVTY